MIDKINKRLLFYSTVIPLAVMLVYTYSEYKHQEELLENCMKVHNRQLQVTSMCHMKLMEDLRMRHMADIVHRHHHHQQEIGNLIEFYSTAIDEIKK